MGGFRRQVRRFRRKQHDYIWSAVILNNQQLTAGTVFFIQLATTVDWSQSGAHERGATLLRCRGWLSTNMSTGAGPALAGLFGYVALFDEDEAVGTTASSTAIATYGDEDILTTLGGTVLKQAATDGTGPVVNTIDIKAKRKLQSGKDVDLVLVATTANLFSYGVVRSLIRVGA